MNRRLAVLLLGGSCGRAFPDMTLQTVLTEVAGQVDGGSYDPNRMVVETAAGAPDAVFFANPDQTELASVVMSQRIPVNWVFHVFRRLLGERGE